MMVEGFKKMFQKHPKFKGIWNGSTSKRNEKNSKGKFASKVDTNQNIGYGYGFPDDMIKNCLNMKKKNERTRFKSKKAGKRAMVVT